MLNTFHRSSDGNTISVITAPDLVVDSDPKLVVVLRQ